MSRHTVQIAKGIAMDERGTIGFDPSLQTFFLQAFFDAETEECALRLGTLLEEFPTLESVIEKARAEGYEVHGLSGDTIMALIVEAGSQHPPNSGGGSETTR